MNEVRPELHLWQAYCEKKMELEEAQDEIKRLRDALRPFATLFLYPDDLGFEAASDIKADDDWCEDSNDATTENVFIVRRHVRIARAALGEGGE